ncbi:MAG: carboxypeptidase regulatory-like domain-containing protein, partial [Nannocystaceae bacterium]|nr:carboxypeptidase regulatory-like domain-containing protein [Nannocystaceae bacterium]
MADFRKTPVLVASSLVALAFSGCGDLDSDSLPNEPAEVEKDDEADAPMTQLRGALLDVDGAPVANAEVRLAVGSVPVTEPVMTDAEGNYTLAFPTAEAKWAWSRGQEVTVLFNTPKRDEGAPGAEGDLIHLLPATLDELVDAELVVENAELEADTAYVPRQGQGFKITDD